MAKTTLTVVAIVPKSPRWQRPTHINIFAGIVEGDTAAFLAISKDSIFLTSLKKFDATGEG